MSDDAEVLTQISTGKTAGKKLPDIKQQSSSTDFSSTQLDTSATDECCCVMTLSAVTVGNTLLNAKHTG